MRPPHISESDRIMMLDMAFDRYRPGRHRGEKNDGIFCMHGVPVDRLKPLVPELLGEWEQIRGETSKDAGATWAVVSGTK